MTKFAWRISEDNLYTPFSTLANEAGTAGPRNADETLLNLLETLTPEQKMPAGTYRYKFRMYDDDDILYYTGYLATDSDMPDEEALMAPLYDFGGPNAGAVLIKYEGHPRWDIEY